MTLEELLADGDWEEAFGYCGEPGTCAGGSYQISRCMGDEAVAVDPFIRADVAEVIASHIERGNYAETDVLGVFRLRDGRYAFVTAGCDTTGWDCQAGGHAIVSTDLDRLKQFGIGEAERAKLGL